MSGFETGDTNEWTVGTNGGAVGVWTVGTTTVHGGQYSVSGSVVSTDHRITGVLSTGATTMYGRVYFELTGLNANIAFGQFEIFNLSGPLFQCQVYVITNGSSAPSLTLGLSSTGGPSPSQIGSPSSVAINASTYYQLGLQMVVNASTGQCNLQINGTTQITATGQNTGSANVAYVQPMAANILGTGSPAGTVYFDDVLVSTSGYPNAGSIIARQCNTATPVFNTWSFSTGANIYNVWDDTPVDNDFANSSTANAKQACGVSFGNTTDTGATGRGSGLIVAASIINAADLVWLGQSKATGDTTQDSSIWFPNGGSETDTVGPLAYPGNQTSTWEWTIVATPTTAQVLSLQVGMLHANVAFQHNVYGIWTMVDYNTPLTLGSCLGLIK